MLILLPPSEGKSAPEVGPPVSLSALSYPELAESRHRVGDALAKVSAQRNALGALGVGPGLAGDVARNTTVWSNAADAATRVYSGVLYEAAGSASWSGATMDRAAQRVRIISALWGVLSPADAIPAYRLSMYTRLGRIGALASFWKPRITPLLDHAAGGSLIVDCRSGPYVAAYKPESSLWVPVSVAQDRGGRRTVVSHNAKHTRGLLTAALVSVESPPGSPQELADFARHALGPAVTAVELEGNRLTLVTPAP